MPLKVQRFWFSLLGFSLLLISSDLLMAQTQNTVRWIDLFELRGEKIIWRDDLKSFTEKIRITNIESLIQASRRDAEAPIKIVYQDASGQTQELKTSSRAEWVRQWQYHFLKSDADSATVINNTLVISHFEKQRIHWKTENLTAGINFAYGLLLGGSIIPEHLADTRVGKFFRVGKFRRAIEKQLTTPRKWNQLNCRPFVAALASRLPGPLAAVALKESTRRPVDQYDLENQHDVIQQKLVDYLRQWKLLIEQPASEERDLELSLLFPKIISSFENLKLLAHPDMANALARLKGRDSSTHGEPGTLPQLLGKIQKQMNEDRPLIDSTFSFTDLSDKTIAEAATRLKISEKVFRKRIQDLQDRLNRFRIVHSDPDLKRYQQLRSSDFSKLKSIEEFSVRPFISGGDQVYDIDGQALMIDDAQIRIGLEKRLQSNYYYQLYREDFEKLMAEAASEFLTPHELKMKNALDIRPGSLNLAEALRWSYARSEGMKTAPEEAYRRFVENKKMPPNALDALYTEMGFLESLKNLKGAWKSDRVDDLIAKTADQYRLAQAQEFEALANSYWNELLNHAQQQFDDIALSGRAELLPQLRNPGSMPKEFWAEMIH